MTDKKNVFFVEPSKQWVLENIHIEKIFREFDKGGITEVYDLKMYHYINVYVKSISRVLYYYLKQFFLKRDSSICLHPSSITVSSNRGGYEISKIKQLFDVNDSCNYQINGFDLTDCMRVNKISLKHFLVSFHQSILVYFSVLKSNLPKGVHKAILRYSYINTASYSFFDIFFYKIKKINPDCIIYSSGVPLSSYAAIRNGLKVININHGLMSKIDLNVYPRYSEIYVYSDEEKKYLENIDIGSIVRVYPFKDTKHYNRSVIIFLPTSIPGYIEKEEFSNLIGLFKRHNYKVFFKRHPLKSSWSIQTWKEKFNFEKVVNGGDAVTVMQDICPSFVVGWTSTALCEASNMKIIPISLINLLDKKGIGTLDIFPIQNRSILWPSEKNMIYDVITKKTRDSYSETLEKLRLR